jgi:hypothetical protein
VVADCLGDLLEAVAPAADECHGGAFDGQRTGGVRADAPAGGGDERDGVFQRLGMRL